MRTVTLSKLVGKIIPFVTQGLDFSFIESLEVWISPSAEVKSSITSFVGKVESRGNEADNNYTCLKRPLFFMIVLNYVVLPKSPFHL